MDEKLFGTSMKEQLYAKQLDTGVSALKQNRDKLPTTEAWLESLGYCKTNDKFEKVGDAICDAIVLPKCPLLFKEKVVPSSKETPFKKMQDFLVQMGLPVSLVCQAVDKDCVFVQIEDARNNFTAELLGNIRSAIAHLVIKTYILLRWSGYGHNTKYMRAQIQRIYVRQIDYTQDISGAIIFSLSLANPCSELHAAIK